METVPDQSRFIVEFAGRAFGILVKSGGRYLFFAADRVASKLDRRSFRSASEAQKALAALLDSVNSHRTKDNDAKGKEG